MVVKYNKIVIHEVIHQNSKDDEIRGKKICIIEEEQRESFHQ